MTKAERKEFAKFVKEHGGDTTRQECQEYATFMKKYEEQNQRYDEWLRLNHEIAKFGFRLAGWTGIISGAAASALVGGAWFRPSFEALESANGWKQWVSFLVLTGVGALVGLLISALVFALLADHRDINDLRMLGENCKDCDHAMAERVRSQRESEEYFRDFSGSYPPGQPWDPME